jgi:hypothetical protein
MPVQGPADHLASAPMSRVRAALTLSAGVAVTAIGTLLGAGVAGATTAPPTPPPATAVAVAVPPATTVPGASAATTAPGTLPPAGSRGGTAEGAVVKPTHETWSAERILVTTALAVTALAAIGYVYGKLRSVPPKHPDLARRAEDLEVTG